MSEHERLKRQKEAYEEMDRLWVIWDWIQSQEGQEVLQDAYARTKKYVDEPIESRRVSMRELMRPFDK